MRKKILSVYITLVLVLAVSYAGAFNDALREDIPIIEGAQVAWENKPYTLNNRQMNLTRLNSDKEVQEILAYYRQALPKNGWTFLDEYKVNNALGYKKGDEFLYVLVSENGRDFPRDVFIATSNQDLVICLELKDYMMKTPIAQDAPGEDFNDVLRYPGAKRRVDIGSGVDSGMIVYEAAAQPQEIASFYSRSLKENGWELNPAFRPGSLKDRGVEFDDVHILFFEKENDSLVITINLISQPQEKTRSFISIMRNINEHFSMPVPQKEG